MEAAPSAVRQVSIQLAARLVGPTTGGKPAVLSETRRKILDILNQAPGATIQAIADGLGVTHTTATYHLYGLREQGLVVQEREGRTLRNYARPVDHKSDEVWLRQFLQDDRQRRLVRRLAAHSVSQVTVNRLATEAGVYHNFLKRMLERFEEHRLVRIDQRRNRYYVQSTPKLQELVQVLLKDMPEAGPGPAPPEAPHPGAILRPTDLQ